MKARQRKTKRSAPLVLAPCPVCQSHNTAFKYRIERHAFDVWWCRACGSEFQNPMPKEANAFYTEGYYTGDAAFSYQDERKKEHYHNFVHRARLSSIKRFLNMSTGATKYTHASGVRQKLLDVGCAFGAFVRAATAAGFEAYGLDVSRFAVAEGNKIAECGVERVRLFQGDLLRLPNKGLAKEVFAQNSFSVITLVEVAEHLEKPSRSFEAAFNLLKPGGVLVIQTANFEGWQARTGENYHYYLPGHLVYYTASGLRTLLERIGFREFHEFFPVDFSLWAKWRKAWGDVHRPRDLLRLVRMSFYHAKSKLKWRGSPLTSSYVLYARK